MGNGVWCLSRSLPKKNLCIYANLNTSNALYLIMTSKKSKRIKLGNQKYDDKDHNEDKITKTNNTKRNAQVVKNQKLEEGMKHIEDPPKTDWERSLCSERLTFSFFDTPCEELAQNLLGKILIRKLDDNTILKGKIVETESYLGVIDKASQTYQNKVTPRNLPMYMSPGTTYVYLTYGMYHCFNISSQGLGCAVLIRALEPLEGFSVMEDNRNLKPRSNEKRKIVKSFKTHELCNGPSKMCMALKLDVTHNKYSLCHWRSMWIENNKEKEDIKIVKCARIGIDSAGPEWANKPLRYYIYGNKSVSKRDKKAESIYTAMNTKD